MAQQKQAALHVCFCFTDNSGDYYKHPLVALASVYENTTTPVRAHIVCDESCTESGKKAFLELGARYGQEVLFYAAPSIPQTVLGNVRACFGKGSLFRLFVPELIAEERVLYLDCDVICGLDIRDVFEWDMGEALVAGVVDEPLRDDAKSAAYLRRLGIDPEHYINAGVMLMDLAKLRVACPDYKDFVFAFIAGKKEPRYPDQDGLNSYFQSKNNALCFLPAEYNYLTGHSDKAHLAPCAYAGKILHFTRGKPWKELYPAALSYWKYYARVFSCEAAFAGMERLSQPEHAHLFNFILQNPKVRRMLNRLWRIYERGFGTFLRERLFPAKNRNRRANR